MIESWAATRKIVLDLEYKGYAVRSFWLHDQSLQRRAQIWIDAPGTDGFATIHASMLDPASPTRWGAKQEWQANVDSLDSCLSKALAKIDEWEVSKMTESLHRELWTSWASLLRSYAAMHGLNSTHHAVVEVGANEIILRVDTHWLRFTQTEQQSSQGTHQAFALNEDGTVTLGGTTDEMDMTAEAVTRTLFQSH